MSLLRVTTTNDANWLAMVQLASHGKRCFRLRVMKEASMTNP